MQRARAEKLAAKLERIQRIASGDVPQPPELRARELQAEPVTEQMVKPAEAQGRRR